MSSPPLLSIIRHGSSQRRVLVPSSLSRRQECSRSQALARKERWVGPGCLSHPQGQQAEVGCFLLQDVPQVSHVSTHSQEMLTPGALSHVSHTILAQWALGANERLLQAVYERPQPHLTPAPAPALEITKDNWTEHLGDPK